MIELSTGMKTAMILFMLQFIVCIICCWFAFVIMKMEAKRRCSVCAISNLGDVLIYTVIFPIVIMSPLYGLVYWIRFYL